MEKELLLRFCFSALTCWNNYLDNIKSSWSLLTYYSKSVENLFFFVFDKAKQKPSLTWSYIRREDTKYIQDVPF